MRMGCFCVSSVSCCLARIVGGASLYGGASPGRTLELDAKYVKTKKGVPHNTEAVGGFIYGPRG